jgi:phosphatidylserine decarboxylase
MKTDQIDMTQFVIPEGGYKTFWDFFLRKVKPGARPIAAPNDPTVVVSPSDGGTCQIFVNNLDTNFKIKRDELNIRQALNDSPYAEKFVGGPVLDTLLWFTDYHHFHAPVSGKIVELSEYPGSYNYDFDEVSWYADLAKHKRLCYVFETEAHGYVAMIPVGFWGVGSCIPTVKEGDVVKKGQEIGHFGYGGSSILLVFEPGAIEYTKNFPVNRKNRRDGGFTVKQGQEIGKFIK